MSFHINESLHFVYTEFEAASYSFGNIPARKKTSITDVTHRACAITFMNKQQTFQRTIITKEFGVLVNDLNDLKCLKCVPVNSLHNKTETEASDQAHRQILFFLGHKQLTLSVQCM